MECFAGYLLLLLFLRSKNKYMFQALFWLGLPWWVTTTATYHLLPGPNLSIHLGKLGTSLGMRSLFRTFLLFHLFLGTKLEVIMISDGQKSVGTKMSRTFPVALTPLSFQDGNL